jgi:hypothetical protein
MVVASKSGGSVQEVAVMATWKLTAGALSMPGANGGYRSQPVLEGN